MSWLGTQKKMTLVFIKYEVYCRCMYLSGFLPVAFVILHILCKVSWKYIHRYYADYFYNEYCGVVHSFSINSYSI